MLRSVQPLARRSLSVASQGSGSGSGPVAAAPAQSPVSATPPPPAPPPPRRSLMLRVVPLATVSAAGYVAYRASVDNEFRTTVTTTFPQAAPVVDLLPQPSNATDSSSAASRTTVQLRIDDPSSATPPISSSKSAPASADEKLSPSASQSTSAAPSPSPSSSATESKPDPVAKQASTPANSATVPNPFPIVAQPAAPHPPTSAMPADDPTDPTHRSMSGKEKLARLIGKGDFSADDVRSKEVVSDTEFRRPAAWADAPASALPPPPARASSSAVARVPASSNPAPPRPAMPVAAPTTPSAPLSGAPAIAAPAGPPATVTAAAASGEADALRSELAAQTRWEAVRLQEAVSAQRVASTKEAAREAGEVARRHAAELTEVRETAAKQLDAAVEERGRVVERRMLAERDAAIETAVARREGEVRDVARADAAAAAAETARGREATVQALAARVEALDTRFGRVVDAGLALREAGQRAAAAFVLRDAVAAGGGEPLGSALKAAGGAGEVGRLAAAAVPETAVRGGVSSVRGLEQDFGAASRRGLAAAAVPEQHAGSLWAHALGAVFSRLKLPVDVRLDEGGQPRNDDERIRLARQLVQEGELGDAVRTLDGLSGLSKEVMSEWVEKAKARLAANMAAEVMTAEAIVSQVGVAAAAQKS